MRNNADETQGYPSSQRINGSRTDPSGDKGVVDGNHKPPATGDSVPNRLAQETSPYLLQHAENPVEWYPWGEEALDRARKEDKPILLSIGYSACHWCHVMERESFEDAETAAMMNHRFVNIKVDREERPDIDSIYMRAVQASVGRGGWPLTAFLTPDGRFFFGGTYFPPEPRFGMPSFKQVLSSVSNAYQTRREEIESGATRLLSALEGVPPRHPPTVGTGGEPEELLPGLAAQTLTAAARYLKGQFDPPYGGFGPAPKFPQPVTLEFLLNLSQKNGDQEALEMVLTTLRSMARGGMRDHLGGGFHRYSVDDRWLVPHFEKMLYDNGLLARAYLHAFQITGDEELKDTVTSTLDYVLEDLTDPEGGFYSARDADSEGEEGTFYLWTPEEIGAVLSQRDAALFCRAYDVTAAGNFEGKNILHLSRGLDSLAQTEGVPVEALAETLLRGRERLRAARGSREAPFRDEKVLVSWNSFVLRALAEAGACLGRVDYLEAARTNADFLLRSLRKGGMLMRSWKAGESKIPAFLEDYAGLGNALLTLYEATLEPRWMEEARELAEQVLEFFWEEDEGLFFDSARDGEQLVVRPRDAMDSATPSGNSLALELLLRCSALFGTHRFREMTVRALMAEADAATRFPSAFGHFLSSLSFASGPPLEIVLLGDRNGQGLQDQLSVVHGHYLPSRLVAGGTLEELPPLPLFEGREPKEGRATAYVCREFACSPPILDPEALAAELGRAAQNQ
jgi:uncharacterized protein YyaL (SSP411 family)